MKQKHVQKRREVEKIKRKKCNKCNFIIYI